MKGPVRWAVIILMGAMVLTATGDGFAQSYSGLYGWALEHKVAGWKAQSFPLLVDLFIGVGELGLFLLALDGFQFRRKSALSWLDLLIPGATAVAGWGVSVVFNVGHVRGGSFADQATAAIPPVASMVGLVILLRTLHRYVSRVQSEAAAVAEPVEDAPAELVAEVEVERVFNRPQLGSAEAADAGQAPFITLVDAVMSARAAGLSQQVTADAFHITKYRVQQIEKEQAAATEPAEPATADDQRVGAA